MSMESRVRLPGAQFLGCLLVSVVMLGLDAWKIPSTWHQWQTRDYLTTQGTVTSSRWIEHRGGKGTTFTYEMSYRYAVAGQNHVSEVVTASPLLSGVPHALQGHFPLHSDVTVYYSPRDPGDSVLLQGLQGVDLLCLLLLFPVHLWFLGSGYVCVRSLTRSSDELGTFTRHGRTHVPLSLGLDEGFGFSLAVLALGVLVCCVTNAFPSLWLMAFIWAGVLAGTGIILRRWWTAWRSGVFELVLDERHEWISVPPMFGRPVRLQVPMSRLLSLHMDTRRREGHKGVIQICWRPILTLAHADGRREELLLAEWWEEPERAEALVDLLRQRVGRALREAA